MVGQIVCSAAGRDRGKFLVIVGFDGSYPLVCDGKERPLENPKRKNPKHLKFTNAFLEKELFTTNKSLRRALNKYRQDEI